MPGIFGLPDQVWSRAYDWNDYYLLNNHPTTDPVYAELTDMNTIMFNAMNGDEVEAYGSWSEVSAQSEVYSLSANEVLSVGVGAGGDSGAVNKLTTGESGGITGGIAYISSTIQSYIDVQKPVRMKSLDRAHVMVFTATNGAAGMTKYRGIPTLSLNIQSTASTGMIIVYLVGVDRLGYGHLFSYSPWTFKNISANTVTTLTIPITVTSYDLDKGHELGLIIT